MDEEAKDCTEETAEIVQAHAAPSRKRLAFLVIVLAVLTSVFGFGYRQLLSSANALAEAARPRIEKDTAELGPSAGKNTASVVTVSRDMLLFGKARGKVSVYMKHGRDYSGIDYFYELNDGEWQLTESGHCSSAECRERAKKAFGE